MKKHGLIILFLTVMWMLLAGCGDDISSAGEVYSEPEIPARPEAVQPEYGALQPLVDSRGFPIELRYTEGMGIIWYKLYEDHAEREWHHSMDGDSEHRNIEWTIEGDILMLSGGWEEVFTVNTENGTATSGTDGTEYRLLVFDENGDGKPWTDAGAGWER